MDCKSDDKDGLINDKRACVVLSIDKNQSCLQNQDAKAVPLNEDELEDNIPKSLPSFDHLDFFTQQSFDVNIFDLEEEDIEDLWDQDGSEQ